MHFLFVLLAIFLLSYNSFALAPNPDVLIPAGIAGVLGAGIIGIIFMLSKFFQDATMEAYGKELLRELIAGAISVFIVYALVFGSLDLLPILTGQTDVGSIIVSKLDSYNAALGNDYEWIIRTNGRVGIISSYYYSMTTPSLFISVGKQQSPFTGMAGLRTGLNRLSNEAGNGIIIYETIKLFYYFFSSISSLIFAIGFALRIIPFTRKAGGMMMAIGFAAAVLYPYSVYLSSLLHDEIIADAAAQGNPIHSQLSFADLDKITMDIPQYLITICTNPFIRIFTSLNEYGWWAVICIPLCIILSAPPNTGFFAACIPPNFNGVCFSGISYPFFQGVQAATMLASSVAMAFSTKNIMGKIGGDPGVVYDIVIEKLVMPVSAAASLPMMELIFIGIIILVGTRSLSGVFGGEMHIAGLGRLI